MKKKTLTTVILMSALLCACNSASDNAGSSQTTAAQAESETEEAPAQENPEVLTGKGKGFGGVITAQITMADGVITDVVLEGADETPGIGGQALEELAGQVAEANGAEIDGVSGATITSEGVKAAVLNALNPEENPYEEPEETQAMAATEIEPITFPEDKKIVSATTYGIYTKKEDSFQDAVIKATLYWNQTDDAVYDIRFLQAMLPWDDNGATGGWANMTDETIIQDLGEGVISFVGDEHGSQAPCNYAKYIQIGDIVWTGELGSDPACEQAVVYTAQIDGKEVRLNDYVASEEGGAWYHEAALTDAYILKTPQKAQEGSDNIVMSLEITYKETNGHGEAFWTSDIKFSGNMEAIKTFVTENGFGYDYYKNGGISQNDEGYWQTVDGVSGATLDETPSYLDILKTLYERTQEGEYTEEN